MSSFHACRDRVKDVTCAMKELCLYGQDLNQCGDRKLGFVAGHMDVKAVVTGWSGFGEDGHRNSMS